MEQPATYGYRVYRMNDFDWVAALSLKEAHDWYAIKGTAVTDDPRPLTPEEMDTLLFVDEPGAVTAQGGQFTFKEALGLMIARGWGNHCTPFMFAQVGD